MLKKGSAFFLLAGLGLLAACASGGDEEGLSSAVLEEMRSSVDFASVEQMLLRNGQKLVLDEGHLEGAASGGFRVTIPVVNEATGEHDLYERLSFEQAVGAAPIVALEDHEREEVFPGYQPQCYLYCDGDGVCVEVCSGGGGSGGSGGSGGCGTYKSTDTCRLSGTLMGTCVDGTPHYAYQRKNRYWYAYGRYVTNKDTVYSCGLVAASTNCNSTCTPGD